MKTSPDTILILGHEASLTGAPKSLLYFSQWLHRNTDAKIAFILQRGGPLLPEYEAIGPVFIWQHTHSPPGLLTRAMNKVVRQDPESARRKAFLDPLLDSVAVIYSNTCTNGHILDHVKKYIDKPVISRIAELAYALKVFNQDGHVSKTFGWSDAYIAVSEAVKSNLVENEGISAGKVHVCHGGIPVRTEMAVIDRAQVRTGLGLPQDKLIVGGCGLLSWRKGYDIFIRLARLIGRSAYRDRFHFIWIGGVLTVHTRYQIEKEMKMMGLADMMDFFDHTSDIADYYNAMDVFFMSSREDPFPLVNLEAAQAGLPVICFENAGGSPEFVLQEKSGCIADYEDLEAIAEYLCSLADDPDRLQQQGAASFQRSLEFSIGASAEKIYAAIRQHSSLKDDNIG